MASKYKQKSDECKEYLYADIVNSIRLAKEEGFSNELILSALMRLISDDILPELTKKEEHHAK